MPVFVFIEKERHRGILFFFFCILSWAAFEKYSASQAIFVYIFLLVGKQFTTANSIFSWTTEYLFQREQNKLFGGHVW